jgi:GH43 family beta-xylosidase
MINDRRMSKTPKARFKCAFLKVLFLLACLLTAGGCADRPASSSPVTFRNPLNLSHGSDPWMVHYNGMYYLAATTWSPTSSPGLTMKSATTIQGLKEAEPVSIYSDDDPSRCCNFWAPEFHLLDGPNGPHWYFYYSGGPTNCCDGQRMHVLESAGSDPMGPYTYKARLRDSIDGWAIDHTILQLNGLFLSADGARINGRRGYFLVLAALERSILAADCAQ